MTTADQTRTLAEQVAAAADRGQPLCITAGGSHGFYGRAVAGEMLDVRAHRGIIDYQPGELVVTARSGTPLHELEAALAAKNQMLAFEPPRHGEGSTLGGAIACGLSGPGRACYGAARDFVLGATIINGKGEVLRFGGKVMKNVAGYDAARLMVGAQGTLGVLLEISLKVLPAPAHTATLQLDMPQAQAFRQLQQWLGEGLPVTASCYHGQQLSLRLGGTPSAVEAAIRRIRRVARAHACDNTLWRQLQDQRHAFFCADNQALWRISQPPSAAIDSNTEMADDALVEWHGALCWRRDAADLHARHMAGHATRYALGCATPPEKIFQPLPDALMRLHHRLKQAFDPQHILNPGRLYPGL